MQYVEDIRDCLLLRKGIGTKFCNRTEEKGYSLAWQHKVKFNPMQKASSRLYATYVPSKGSKEWYIGIVPAFWTKVMTLLYTSPFLWQWRPSHSGKNCVLSTLACPSLDTITEAAPVDFPVQCWDILIPSWKQEHFTPVQGNASQKNSTDGI